MSLKEIDVRPLYNWLGMKQEAPGDYMMLHGDVIFVLGAGSEGPIKMASALLALDRARYVAFTSAGGNFGGNIVFGQEECDFYRQCLEPLRWHDRILYPPPGERTTNTLAEAQKAIPFIRKRVGDVQRVILCSRPVHQRRAFATFSKQHPDVEYVNVPCDEPVTVEHLPRMLDEMERLRLYAEKGDIVFHEPPKDVLEIYEELRRYLKRD